MTITGVLLLIFIPLLFVNYVYKRRKLYYYASKFDGPPTLPFIGSAFYLCGGKKKAAENIVYLFKKYKSPWKIWIGRWLYVVLTKPEDMETVLNQALEKATNYKFVKPILGEGLFTGPVKKWKPHRKVIMTTFNMPILNGFVEIFADHSLKLISTLESYVNKGYFDVFPIMTQCALEITCETTMGGNPNGQSDNVEFVKYFARAMELVYWRMFNYWFHVDFMWKLTAKAKELDELIKKISSFVQTIVKRKKQEYHEQKRQGDQYYEDFKRKKSFIDLLIEEGQKWSDEELMEEAQTMVAAGSESLGFVKSYVLVMLAMHPQIQDRVYSEIREICSDNRTVTPEDLPKMRYLERAIKETLRLFPVAVALGRRVDKDIVTSTYVIPAGCECLLGIMYTHRNPEIWPDPLKFDPDRFLPENFDKVHPYSYIPFSGGPRNCIGFKYALMVLKTAVATIIRHFRVSTDFKSVSEIEFIPGMLLKPIKGHRISLQHRI